MTPTARPGRGGEEPAGPPAAPGAHPEQGDGPGDFRVPADDEDAALREDLARRTRRILETPRPAPDPERAAQEKAVLHESRYLMRLLAGRRRSEGELRTRLREREVPADVAHEAMARLQRADLLDDAAFAAEWVRQRRGLRALSDEALRRELRGKQVDPALIEQALAQPLHDTTGLAAVAGEEELDTAEREEAEAERCRALVRSRLRERDRAELRADRDGSARQRVTRRLDALLTRKGYPGDLAVRVIAAEVRAAREEPADR